MKIENYNHTYDFGQTCWWLVRRCAIAPVFLFTGVSSSRVDLVNSIASLKEPIRDVLYGFTCLVIDLLGIFLIPFAPLLALWMLHLRKKREKARASANDDKTNSHLSCDEKPKD